jgi:predicted  nucleic acid-binding Zn-ribbon protein
MSQLQAILKYQEVDGKLFKLESALAESEERKKYAKLRKFLKTAPEKLDAYEVKAATLKAEAAALTAKYEQLEGTLKDFENVDELIGGGADVSFYKKKAQSVFEQIKKIKAELTALMASVKALDEEYQDLKKKVIAAQKQYDGAKKAYEDLEITKASERDAIKAELAALEKEIDKGVLARYQTKRKEIPFPIVVEAVGARCPYCSNEFSIVARGNLASGVDCEMCKKIVFGS